MKTLRNAFVAMLVALPLLASQAAAEKRPTSLTQEQIREVVRKETTKVSACYAKHAMKQEDADGKVNLHLVIKASGKVGSVEVEAPSVRGEKFSRCVVDLARRWEFPEAAAETEVIYPFFFVHANVRNAGP